MKGSPERGGATPALKLSAHALYGVYPNDKAHCPGVTITLRFHTAKILIVDDADVIVRFLSVALPRAGHDCAFARSGPEGIEAGGRMEQIDLLIVDHSVFPSGRAIAESIRRSHPDMPVLHISGYPLPQMNPASITPGASFLQKPFSVEQLTEAVAAALNGKRADHAD